MKQSFFRRSLAGILVVSFLTQMVLIPVVDAREWDKKTKKEILREIRWKTKFHDFKNSINETDSTKKEKKIASLRKSLKKDGRYRLLIQSTQDIATVTSSFSGYDASIQSVTPGVYSIQIPTSSDFATEVLAGIETDSIPEKLLDIYPVIAPTLVESLDEASYLSGESLPSLWWIEKVGASTWQEDLAMQPQVKVAVLDTGVDSTHPDLSGGYDSSLSYNFITSTSGGNDDNGHGTKIAGIIAWRVNGAWVFWVNANASIVSLKVLDANGYGTTYDILDAIDYAKDNSIKVLNMSFGWPGTAAWNPICSAISDAKANGITTVVAAGNSHTENANLIPAICSDAITVWASTASDARASFSNYGSSVDLYAPGVSISTTTLSGGYTSDDGTSLSAAFVSGLASKELAYDDTLSPDTILTRIGSGYSLLLGSGTWWSGGTWSGGESGSWVWLTGTGLSETWGIVNYDIIQPPIDYNTYHYYSGIFEQDGAIYGNSLYPDSLSLTGFDTNAVEVMTYAEYLLARAMEGSGTFQALTVQTGWLIGEWYMSGDLLDSSGNGLNLTPSSVSWTGGIIGSQPQSAYFNGSADGSRSDDLGLDGSVQPFTYSMWIKPDSTISSQTVFINHIDAGQHVYSYIEWYAGAVRLIRVRGWIIADIAPYTITLTGWVAAHLAWTYDGSDLRLYINGVHLSTYASPGNGSYGYTDGFFVGWYQWAGAKFTGAMQMVRVYSGALSASGILDLYNDPTDSLSPPPPSNNVTESVPAQWYHSDPTLDSDPTNPDRHAAWINEVCKVDSAVIKANTAKEWDPVNLANGEFTYDNTLMSIPWVGTPYEFKINYKNQTYYNGPVGINWDHNYNIYLTGDTLGNMVLYDGRLWSYRFFPDWGGGYVYNGGIRANLVLTGGIYKVLYDDGRITTFNSNNRVSAMSDPAGNTLSMSYSGTYLTGVTDTLGRTMSYAYYSHNRLQAVTDMLGHKAELSYYTGWEAGGLIYDLKNIVLTSGTGITKTIGFNYTTVNADDLGHNMTKLTDANGHIYVENEYNYLDRVATQRYGSGTLTYTYTLSWSAVTKNTVVDKLGLQAEYNYDTNGNNTSVKYYNSGSTSSGIYNYTYNGSGLVTKETRPRGNGYVYSYDARGNPLEKRFKTDTSDSGTGGDLVTTYTYDALNHVLSETSPTGARIIYTRDSIGNILTKTYADIRNATGATYTGTTTYTYLSGWLLSTFTTAEGNITRFTYSGGQVSTIARWTWSLTSTGMMTYDIYGNMLSLTDGEWSTKTLGYTPWNLLSTGTTDIGFITALAYDANNNKTRETRYVSWTAINTYFYYDSLDRVTSTLMDTASGQKLLTTYRYDENNNVIEKQVGSGALVKYAYDEFAKVTEERIIMVPGNSSYDIVTSYTYDTNSNLISQTDPRGNTTTYSYSHYDRITETTLPDGTTYNYTYNPDNTVASTSTKTSSTGTTLTLTHIDYDGYGNKVKTIDYLSPSGSTWGITTSYLYTLDMKPLAVIDPRGNTTSTLYDGLGRVKSTTDALGNTTSYTYDKRDLVLSKTLTSAGWASPVTTTYTYDDDGRLVNEEDELTEEKTYGYNALGQVSRIVDENSHPRDFSYDYRGKKISESEVNSWTTITTTYSYDERGNLLTVTDPESHTMSYEYDGIDRPTRTTYPDSQYISSSYDKNGNLTSRTDPNGTTITNTYSNVDRLTNRAISTWTWVLGVTGEYYTYDKLGRLTSGEDSLSWALSFSYDALSRLTAESQFISGSTTKTTWYSYDSWSNLKTLTYPDSRIESFSYDTLNRPTAITFSGDTIASYIYTWVLLSNIALGNSTSTAFSYDALLRPDALTTPGRSYDYTYAPTGDITDDGDKDYTYDALRRLTGVSPSRSWAISESYNYDKTGNRTTASKWTYPVSPIATSYTTNNLDQYTATTGWDNKTYTYDNNWNLRSDGSKLYSYDYQNRLIEVRNSATNNVIATYSYDLLGRRTQKVDTSRSSSASETTLYVYANANTITEEKTLRSGTSSLVLNKVFINWLGTDSLLAYDTDERTISDYNIGKLTFCDNRVFPYESEFNSYSYTGITTDCSNLLLSSSWITTNRYYIHTNHQGSVISLTNSSGTIIQKYEYDSFWNPYVITATNTWSIALISIASYTGSLHENTRLYTWREYDRETWLYFLRARYYSPSTGKFISRDPIGQNDQINLYTYVGNSPMMYNDPFWKAKLILWAIYNAKSVQIDLVARALKIWPPWVLGVHSYIEFTITDHFWNITKYSVWGYYNNVTWKLEARFNYSDDVAWSAGRKWTYSIPTPSWMTSKVLATSIINESTEYNKDQKDFATYGADLYGDDYQWNCNNFSTTMLARASNYSREVLWVLEDANPFGANPGLWEYFLPFSSNYNY